MTEPPSAPIKQLCVSFYEALNWIAFRNLAGRMTGPLPLFQVLARHEDEWAADANSRIDFAEELLLSWAARGAIKLYADTWESDREDRKKDAVQVIPKFVARAKIDHEDGYGPSLYWLSEDQEIGERYERVAVDYNDLAECFWGKDNIDSHCTPIEQLDKSMEAGVREEERNFTEYVNRARHRTLRTGITAIAERSPRPMSRRGRPTKHKWSELTAAAVGRCLNRPISRQEELVREMLTWCVEHWGEEPTLSDIRAYIAPIFKKFEVSPRIFSTA
jgi:hypothetical protein